MTKQRLDTLLVERNLCSSRQQAQALIRAGEVRVNGQVVDKPGTEVDIQKSIIGIIQKSAYVSRGGEKLAKALKTFDIDVKDRVCLDGGISTGGFTDCLLQNGAKKVYGIDVGYGQVAWNLRQDERVTLKERTNIRYLVPEDLYRGETPADFGVMDLSFISLTKVLESVWNLLKSPREMVLLVKPQFEVGKEKVGKKGVVRDTRDHATAILGVLTFAVESGWGYRGLTGSPIVGPAGNVEYLLWLHTENVQPKPSLETIERFTLETVRELSTRTTIHDRDFESRVNPSPDTPQYG